MPARIIQLTDVHLFADQQQRYADSVNTLQHYHATLNAIHNNEKSIDLIVLSGDLSDDGSEASYHAICQPLAEFFCPIAWLPGNHDNKALMAKVFLAYGYPPPEPHLFVNWQVLFVDSAVDNQIEGEITATTFADLTVALQQETCSTLLFMHHNTQVIDGFAGLTNADQFIDFLADYPQVKCCAAGHMHQDITETINDTDFIVTPATAAQCYKQGGSKVIDRDFFAYRRFELLTDGCYKTEVVPVNE